MLLLFVSHFIVISGSSTVAYLLMVWVPAPGALACDGLLELSPKGVAGVLLVIRMSGPELVPVQSFREYLWAPNHR